MPEIRNSVLNRLGNCSRHCSTSPAWVPDAALPPPSLESCIHAVEDAKDAKKARWKQESSRRYGDAPSAGRKLRAIARRVVMLAISLGALLAAAVQAATPLEVIQKVERQLVPGNHVLRIELTNQRLDGSVGSYEVRFQIRDVDSVFGVFQKPEREKGREILRVDDALWTYIPSVGRTLRIADRDSFAGGDFSNADVMRADWSANYDLSLAKETANQWIIDLAAKKDREAAYAKMRLWVGKGDGQPVQQYFYDAAGTLLKICRYGTVRAFGAVSRPTLLVMENVITREKTTLRVLDLQTGQSFAPTRFAVDSLGK